MTVISGKDRRFTDRRFGKRVYGICIGGAGMIKFYVNQIKLGKITVEDVPEKYQEDVRKTIAGAE